jgi:hypothetical protein
VASRVGGLPHALGAAELRSLTGQVLQMQETADCLARPAGDGQAELLPGTDASASLVANEQSFAGSTHHG